MLKVNCRNNAVHTCLSSTSVGKSVRFIQQQKQKHIKINIKQKKLDFLLNIVGISALWVLSISRNAAQKR